MRIVVAALVLCLTSAVSEQQPPPEKKITVQHLHGTVYLLKGGDANMVASVGPDGVFLVDAESPELVQKALVTVTDQPIRWAVNTHFHPDHTAGNPAVTNASIIAHE